MHVVMHRHVYAAITWRENFGAGIENTEQIKESPRISLFAMVE